MYDIVIQGLNVLYEDEHIAAVHKPAGVETRGYQMRTVQNALSSLLSSASHDDVYRPQCVHR
ncbi:MAG: hypothetical protein HKN09_02350, partial [Saprospiraceae bacterium]|nr:hypothetical protein [Saprospiraceae bacterium]